MRDVWITADGIVSPLGFTSAENFHNIKLNRTGISLVQDEALSHQPIYCGQISQPVQLDSGFFTRFESIAILSVKAALAQVQIDTASPRVVFILSTTKGNIELINDGDSSNTRIHLHEAGRVIANYFGNMQQPIVVSNACISGVMALLVAKRLLQSGQYDHAVVVGADVLTRFVISGFQCLQAISPQPCKPFDAQRSGINLGEAAATIVLSTEPDLIGAPRSVKITGGAISNDANHISGPSRTGDELALAIRHAMVASATNESSIDFISAHGTATRYNDEMEAKAFNQVGLGHVALHSLKGYYGHTLGAAGILETVVSKYALVNNDLLPTFGFQNLGVSQPLNVLTKTEHKNIANCLKTASGFGGCNAAIILTKV